MNIYICMRKFMQVSIPFTLLIVFLVNFCGLAHASDELQIGVQYKIVKPVYLMGVFNSLNNRKLSSATARAYLHSTKYYEKSEVAFQYEVPVGTVITFIGSVQKVWYLPFSVNQYLVRLDPDLSSGLDVVLKLNRGLEGSLDGLNPGLFTRVKRK